MKKTQRSLPPFGWDTEPIIGSEEMVEEAFIDVFCDLIYGGGWMDLERAEEFDRECNWAMVNLSSESPFLRSLSNRTGERWSLRPCLPSGLPTIPLPALILAQRPR
jgi:hypothetical protein